MNAKHLWRRRLALCISVVLLLAVMATPASADIGPKPSVEIAFDGLEDEHYYVTLLSRTKSTGPYSAASEEQSGPSHGAEHDIYLKFLDYQDADGFYFLQFFSECTDTFLWGYYPPAEFKILLYFPDYDAFAVSAEIYERYAFDSYYRVDLSGATVAQGDVVFTAERSYNYTWELLSLAARIVLTVLLEIGIALLFGFRAKKQLWFICLVNVATQTALNVLLNLVNYAGGELAFLLAFILLELLVFAVEALVYCIFMKKISEAQHVKRNWLTVVYALAANAVSFFAGLGIAHLLPGIF